MITGFNTDIQYSGVTYHVQTEDKGLETPLILSLVYVGGAIIASKRSPYNDLIEKGFDEQTLTERLQRQHKLICAAIRAGRVEELKKMSGREEAPRPAADSTPAAHRKKDDEPVLLVGEEQFYAESYTRELPTTRVEEKFEVERTYEAPPVFTPPPPPPPEEPIAFEEPAPAILSEFDESEEIYLTLLDDEGEFRAGQLATIKIRVGRGQYGQRPVADAAVTIKVLGTTFRPLILSTKTGADGMAVVRALLPRFTSGRAAIIIRASFGEDFSELRRIIHQA